MATKLVPVFEITMALTPPMVIAVGALKLVPIMVTNVPMEPLSGLKEVMVGDCAKSALIGRIKINVISKINFRKFYFIIYYILN
jgi:hypothetical protein